MGRTGSRIRSATAVAALPALALLAGCTLTSAPAPVSVAPADVPQTSSPSEVPTPASAVQASAPPASAVQASAPPASGYFQYYNRRFGFSLEVPDGYTEQAPPADGDGEGFTSSDGTASVTGFGQDYSDSAMTTQQDLASLLSNYQSSGDTITYQSADDDVAAVSGTTPQGQIFYQRDVVFPTVVYSLVWTYPVADKTEFDPLVDYTASTFTPGPDQAG